ncbi:MAG: ABC transporter substrate-binding protein [Clostridium sp.]|uniref:ABC transporter substrate-binding protein n=1 Tax=Clostridium sp. TaxID=1506 RepID=UPI001EC2E05A|nr:ABC transporter substrate-binding protein [Clostridium sp.]MBS5886265.1 ABC transporter substrate-binding protein [Clostridium sp.]MDU7148295.1 ABC transporter substrate-binding protein [Clostridium sp.]
MKSKLIKVAALIALIGIASLSFISCSKDNKNSNNELTKVRLNEVVRSVFYAPMYVAINEGLFEEEGLEIDLATGQGADATYSYTQHI